MNKTLLPKLRFPEFQEEWDIEKLGNISMFINERVSLEKLSLDNYISTENILPDYEGVAKASKLPPSGSAIQYKKGDILISNIRPYLKKVWFSNKDGGASNDVIIVRAKEKITAKYLSFMLRNDVFIEYVMNGAKGVKMPRGDIFLMKEYPLAYPSKTEQQKIADCLTSLDDLIAAQNQKMEALQIYKKWLMQNLFPAEGESVPRLRFPEFQSAGEWEEIKLGELGTPILGLTYSPSDIRDEGLLVLRSPNIKDGVIVLDDCVYVTPDIKRANLSKPNDILICVRNGSTSLIGKNAIIPDRMPLCTHGAFMTVFRAKTPKFVYELLQTKAYQIQVAAGLGARINSINNSQLVNYKFFVPTLLEEQQRIAELLTALDEQITEQREAVAALNVHKKGLMQGLFPSINEVQE
jgi:type I restriction enzyme S subunit